jgi:amino acid transporter
MDKKGLFLREATGLVRTIGTKEAFLINIAILNPGVGFIYMLWALSFGANADLTISFLVAGFTALFLALAYSQLVSAMPRTGGDYVFTSRLLHPIVGAAVGGGALFVFLVVVATNSAIFSRDFMSGFFNELGLTGVGTFLGQPWPTFIFAALLIILGGYITSLGTRRVSQVMWVLFIIGMLGFFSVMGIYLTHTREQFIAAFNAVSGSDAYNALIAAAKQNGFTPGVTFMSSLLGVPLCAMVYWGFTSANYPAGELKSASQTLKRSVLITLACGFVLLVGIWLSVKRLVGLDFLQSVSFLSTNHGDVYSSITSAPALLSYYATVLSPNAFIRVLIPLSYMCWVAVFVLAYYMVISRVAFAMSFDRLLPEWLSDTHKNNVPVNAITASAIGMIIMLALQVFYSGILAGIFNATLAVCLLYLLVSVSAMVLPFVKPDLFAGSPKIANWKVGNIPGISIIAGLSALFCLFIAYLCVAQPQFIGPASVQALVFTVVMFGWGVVVYFIEKAQFKKATGLDLTDAVKEIPPE